MNHIYHYVTILISLLVCKVKCQNAALGCGLVPVDIVFALDSSGSETTYNFNHMVDFVANFSSNFMIGPQDTQISSLQYNTDVKNNFYLNQYSDKDALLHAIQHIHWFNGETNTHLALDFIRTNSLSSNHGARDNVQKYVIVMTDGRSNEDDLTMLAAQKLKNLPNVTVIAIGIGPMVDRNEIHRIASDRHHVFTVDNFDLLHSVQDELLDKTCTECGTEPADIVFVLDGSGSEGASNFRRQLNFASTVVNKFDDSTTTFGLVTFASSANTEFSLSQFTNKQQVLQAIDQVAYPNGDTRTDLGLTQAQHMLQHHNNHQHLRKRYVIVLTDGRSNEPGYTHNAARKLHHITDRVFAIGIGDNVDPVEIKDIASSPNDIINVKNFTTLLHSYGGIIDEICTDRIPPTTTTSTTPITTTTVKPACGPKPADIVFVLDASESEKQEGFDKQKDFVYNFARKFQIGPDHVQFSVVTFSSGVTNNFNLNKFSHRHDVLNAIQTLPYLGQGTNTSYALKYVHDNSFLPANGGRANASHIVIVMTDGQSWDPHRTVVEANKLKQMATVFAIGIGDELNQTSYQQELAAIMSHGSPFEVGNFDLLHTIQADLEQAACNPVTVPTTTTTPATTTTVKPACGPKEADIVFVLDASESEKEENFAKERNFVYNFARRFEIGPNNVQFSTVTYSTAVRNDFYLNTYHNRHGVLGAISHLQYMGQGTNTSDALKFVRLNSFLPAHGARPNATHIVIVITDGASSNNISTIAEANKLKHAVDRVFAIGIGSDLNLSELQAIATNHSPFTVDNFDLLDSIKEQLENEACKHSRKRRLEHSDRGL